MSRAQLACILIRPEPERDKRPIFGDMRQSLHNLFLGLGVVVIAAASMVFALAPSRYTTSSLIRVDPDAAALFRTRPDAQLTPVTDAILDRIGSSEIIDRTVDTYGLGASATAQAGSQQETAIAAIRSGLHVLRTSERGVWRLTYTSERRTLTALVLNDLLQGAQVSQAAAADRARAPQRLLQDAVRRNAADTSAGLIEIRAALSSIEERQTDEQHTPTDRGRSMGSENGHHSSATPSSLPVTRASQGPGVDVDLGQLRAEKVALAARQAELAQRYGLRHPEMVDVLEQIRRVDALIDARSRLEATSDTLVATAAARDIDHRTLLRETQAVAALASRQKALLGDLAERLQAVQRQNVVIADQSAQLAPPGPLDFQVLTRPAQPQAPDPSSARRAALVTALFTAAAMTGAVIIAARERRLLRTATDVQRLFGLPLVATVPDVSSHKLRSSSASRPEQPADLLLEGGSTPFGDAFLTLQRAIGISPAAGASLVVAVCSGLPNEGKTTTSTSLARSAALSGCKVVLIDCDGRRRALSRALGTAAGPGLVEVLGGSVSLQDALALDERSGVQLIGHSATDAVEDLSNPARLAGLLVRLREQFNVIVLDTGPVLALTEARVVAALADEVVFVARWRRTPAKAAQLALQMLASGGAKVRGVVLTMADMHAIAQNGADGARS